MFAKFIMWNVTSGMRKQPLVENFITKIMATSLPLGQAKTSQKLKQSKENHETATRY